MRWWRGHVITLLCTALLVLNGSISRATDTVTGESLPPEAKTRIDEALALRGEKKLPDALKALNAAVEAAPDSVRPLYERAMVYREMEDLYGAQQDLKKAIVLSPEDANLYFERGVTYVLGSHSREALADFNRAVHLRPDWAAAIGRRGEMFVAEGDMVQGLRDLDRAIELDAKCGPAYLGRGHLRRDTSPASAISDYDQAIGLGIATDEAYMGRALAHGNLNEHAKGIADLNLALRTAPGKALLYTLRADMIMRSGDHGLALKQFDAAAKRFPNEGVVFEYRGMALHSLGKESAAKKDFIRACDLGYARGCDWHEKFFGPIPEKRR